MIYVNFEKDNSDPASLHNWIYDEAVRFGSKFHPKDEHENSLAFHFLIGQGEEEFIAHLKEVHGLEVRRREIFAPDRSNFKQATTIYIFDGYEIEENAGLTQLLLKL